MKILTASVLVVCMGISVLTPPLHAQMVTMDEAQTIAVNWVRLIVENKGFWHHSKTAEVEWIEEFRREDRTLGYYCQVRPRGFVIVSLRKEMAPVKAYSADSNIDPLSDEGLPDIIKGGMERILDQIENRFGPIEAVSPVDLDRMMEINYTESWTELASLNGNFDFDEIKMNYQEGDSLLTTNWHQDDPYNYYCPAPPGGDDCTEPRCAVGCVALAGAQIMRYWYWPPFGVGTPYNDLYDWPNMPDTLRTSSPTVEIEAVAELCREIGSAVNMLYCHGDGCASEAYTDDMEDVYIDYYRYASNCNVVDRNDFGAVEWFERMKSDLNANRPIQYRVPGHSIVADGWREQGVTPIRQYHMNYGWAGWVPSGSEWASYINSNCWYTLDALPGSGPDDEYMVEDIFPAPALYGTISGTYTLPTFPYRYFDRDATGNSATFENGHNLQFLPGIVLTCTSEVGGSITFNGSLSFNTRLFTRGDTSKGIRIYDGAVKLKKDGSITFY